MTRENSILTNGDVEHLSTIEHFPIFVNATTTEASKDIFQDLTFDICKESGIIQLRNLIDPAILYSNFHSEALGKVWGEHHNLFAKLIHKYIGNHSVLEIGGSDSRLASNFINKRWTIIDPNIKSDSTLSDVKYIRDFFTEETVNKCDFNMIVHSHVLEHIYDPKLFLSTIYRSLKEGDYHIFSVPNLYSYLEHKFINALTFEHTLLLTEEIVDYLLSIFGFNIEEKVYYDEHSIFYVTKKQKVTSPNLPRRYKTYKDMYLSFFNYYKHFVTDLNKKLSNTDKTVYLFGGHIFSQYLIALGLDISRIKCILDNSELKNSKRLYGTDLVIKFPDEVTLDLNSLVILKAGSYTDEIKSQLLSINKHIQFIM